MDEGDLDILYSESLNRERDNKERCRGKVGAKWTERDRPLVIELSFVPVPPRNAAAGSIGSSALHLCIILLREESLFLSLLFSLYISASALASAN